MAELKKSDSALRTIGEVAEELLLPQHVLRFWETKFPHIKPVKRRGGHRYYRPEDIDVLREIKGLLYDKGLTIRGAKKLLKDREKGDATLTLVEAVDGNASSSSTLRETLEHTISELTQIRKLLEKVS